MLFWTWLILTFLLAAWLMVEASKDKNIRWKDEWKLLLASAFIAGAVISGMFVGVYWFATTFRALFGCIVFGVLVILLIRKAKISKKSKK